MAPPDESQCLSEATLLAWAAGELDDAALGHAERHLAVCEDCVSMMAVALRALGSSADAGVMAESSIPFPGEVVAGKYRVEAIIGMGGMGVLLSARHLELGQLVAIKVLHTRRGDAARRFLHEARAYARLSSPHIPTIYDVGRLPNGTPFLVMELLVGQDLSRLVNEGPLRILDAVSFVQQACAALIEVHRVGMVHRDVKPANLFMVQRPGSTPLIKLLDFGIAKFGSHPGQTDAHSLTSTSQFLGSPLYMSPEQIRDSKTVDVRADVWSLGVVLYQLLTGRAPFQAPSFPSLCVAIATEEPVLPRTLRPEIPLQLQAVILRCLRRPVEARFASVTELAEALKAFVDGADATEAVANASLAATVEAYPERSTQPQPVAALLPVTIMFADVVGFTHATQSLPPEKVARALGLYLDTVTRAIELSGGRVENYMGDAVMATWNAALSLPGHPAAACRAVFGCLQAIAELGQSQWWRGASLAPWRTSFGLHSDSILIGNFGASGRLQHTAIGGGVNLASRLEGLNKLYGTRALVSADVRAHARDRFVFRQVDRVATDARQAVAVYELCGEVDDPAVVGRQTLITRYEAALSAMFERQFEIAYDGFSSLVEDRAANEMAKRCQACIAAPPPADWDGTWTALSR